MPCLLVCRATIQVAAGVNGPLLEMLAEAAEWHDKAAIELFRKGALLFGLLEKSGVGTDVPIPDDADPSKILQNLEERNSRVCVLWPVHLSMAHASCCQVLQRLRDDEHAAQLMQIAEDEVVLGRLCGPIELTSLDLKQCAIATRFGVDQG